MRSPKRPPPPPEDPLLATPFDEALMNPPTAPVPVPNPSPVVLGGVPTDPGAGGARVSPLVWRRQRFSTADLVITLVGGATTLATAIIPPQPAHVRGPVLFDEWAGSRLRARGVQTRYTFRDISDVGLSLSATWPFFVDALASAWWLHGSRDAAEQMALVGLETLAVSGAVQGMTNMLVSRERPYGEECGGDRIPSNALDCTGSTHYRSFFSGHAAFSFTSAALICFNHAELSLLGTPWDQISCGGAYAVAGATAAFRVVSGVHYASDILTGALVGSLVGYGVPLLHRRKPNLGEVRTQGGGVLRIVPAAPAGVGVLGIF